MQPTKFLGCIRGPFPFPSQQVVKGPLAYKVPEAGLGQQARVQGSALLLVLLSLFYTKSTQGDHFKGKIGVCQGPTQNPSVDFQTSRVKSIPK